LDALSELSEDANADGNNRAAVELSAWQHVIHTMLCSNEFIHLR
jgi:hypothetical protein